MVEIDDESWRDHRRFILSELRRMNEGIMNLDKKLDNKHDENQDRIHGLEVNIAMLQVKSGVWGVIGGLVPVTIFLAMEWLKK